MSISYIKLVSRESGVSDGKRVNSELYYVYTISNYRSNQVRDNAAAAGLPVSGSAFGDNTYAKTITVRLKGQAPANSVPVLAGTSLIAGEVDVFEYAVNYEQRSDDSELAPCSRPASIQWGGTDYGECVLVDIDETPVKNAAGQDFDPPPEREAGNATVIITRNECTNPAANIVLYSHTINSATWYGVPVFKAKIGRITAAKVFEEDTEYWEVSYPIEFRGDAGGEYRDWRCRPIEQGTMFLTTASDVSTAETFLDPNGLPRVTLLNANGTVMTSGTPLIANGGDGFKLYNEVAFAGLALPNPFA